MKDEVYKIVKGALRKAENKFFRVSRAFLTLSPDQMMEECGHSGKTNIEIVREYEDHLKKMQKCLKWVENIKE